MFKKTLLFVSVFLAGSMGLIYAQDAVVPVQGNQPAHPRIFALKDRIQSQRSRIAQGLTDNTLSQQHAQDCSNVLDGVESDLKAQSGANGPYYHMRRETYDAYNARLDVNSAFINEKKQTYYYYGTYYDENGNAK
jgi:hypothetical protein